MWHDIRAAFSFLTILPFGYGVAARPPGYSFSAYPVVGLVIGLALAATASLSPLPPHVTAFLVLVAWVIVTGGLHLDGFGDSCDGLLATTPPERRLAIMKDPQAGSWAVIGLILLLLGKWTLIQTVPPLLLVIPPIIGRWAMVIAVYAFPYARASGLGAYFRDGLSRTQVIIASGIALCGVLAAGRSLPPVVIAFGTGAFTIGLVGSWAARRLGGGITGDVYGALCELIELGCLLGFSVWVSG
ncbi:MAG: adenosylcobinamide-GDP ribazoletransferase [bacterium]|nr:adenosylcobinamide-GDP ribazoletransferase [bacterium]